MNICEIFYLINERSGKMLRSVKRKIEKLGSYTGHKFTNRCKTEFFHGWGRGNQVFSYWTKFISMTKIGIICIAFSYLQLKVVNSLTEMMQRQNPIESDKLEGCAVNNT